jgi:hypothetical protein
MTDRLFQQVAPTPDSLFELVTGLAYKAGWEVTLEEVDRGQGSRGLTLCILILTPDSYHPETSRRVMHYMPVPPAAYDRRSWQRWLFDQLLLVERHEACEFFVVDGARPYAPHHGPGNDPYIVFDHGTDEDVRTSYRGEVKL